jgi:ubiquinone/menaquinone biosynthesis C-methylase UbiE
MQLHEAIELIRPAVDRAGGTWADFGAGKGTFTSALAELIGSAGRVLAVDHDAAALRTLRRVGTESHPTAAAIHVIAADVGDVDHIPELAGVALDGVVLGNVLHFLPDAPDVLSRVVAHVRPGGRVIVIEYDGVTPSRWVPYPLPISRFFDIAESAGLLNIAVVGERRSAFHGKLYCAAATRRTPTTAETGAAERE